MKRIALGIDLGTSTSCVAINGNDGARVLPGPDGRATQASVVCFRADGTVLVGNDAKRQIVLEPTRTVHSAKRLMGRLFLSEEVSQARARHAYGIEEAPNNGVGIRIDDRLLSPPEIAALILKKMKQVADRALGADLNRAVITVPAYFNDNQRQATRDAGRIAGLDVLRIINEPTAAALAYGHGQEKRERVAVYDLGGGTFDISILEIGGGVFEVLATAGDTYLGGDDFDHRIVDHLVASFKQQHNIDLSLDRQAMVEMKEAAEQAKRELSAAESAEISVLQIYTDPQGQAYDLDISLNRADLARLCMDLLQRTFKVCDEALQASQLTAQSLDAVILVGGPTRLPLVREAVGHYFQKLPSTSVDPEQAVALGAAIHGDALLNAGTNAMLLDVTPLALRIGTVGGYAEEIIAKNTPIPIESSREFTTVRDGQEKVSIRVFQGESRRQDECTLLGEFEFAGLRSARRGEVTVEVVFEIDANGIVNVTAKDVQTQRQASTSIHLSSGLSDADIASSRELTEQTAIAHVAMLSDDDIVPIEPS